jgi:hypothetical protein
MLCRLLKIAFDYHEVWFDAAPGNDAPQQNIDQILLHYFRVVHGHTVARTPTFFYAGARKWHCCIATQRCCDRMLKQGSTAAGEKAMRAGAA